MTDPTPNDPTAPDPRGPDPRAPDPGAPDPGAPDPMTPDPRLPPESRAARSLTERSGTERSGTDHPRTEDVHTDELHTDDPPEPERGPRVWPRVVGVLILLLGAAGAWIWQNPDFLRTTFGSLWPTPASQSNNATGSNGEAAGPKSGDTPASGVQTGDAAGGQSGDASNMLEDRVARLEQRSSQADGGALAQRLDALEKRDPAAGSTDLAPLMSRLQALEARQSGAPSASPAPDLGPLRARLDSVEKSLANREADAGRVDALSARLDTLAAHDPAAEFRNRLDDVAHKLNDLADNEAKLAAASAHVLVLARLQAASIALVAGHPVGQIPDAPPELARFATTAPPTLAALRVAFPPAAQEALKVSTPDTEGKPFVDRVIARLQDFKLITVREGDRVLIGNTTAATLAHAQTLLDAGDLAGAARDVATLTGESAEKMAPWLADATSLVAAREALASIAEKG
jgi:hypothetical protein